MTRATQSAIDDQFDLFLPYLADLPLRDQREMMERPFFSLAKTKRIKPIDYRSPDGKAWVHVSANPDYGMATIWDADILIYCASTLADMARRGINDIPRKLHLMPYDLLRAIHRPTTGRAYELLGQSLDRLVSTTIKTNIRAENRREATFSWLDGWTQLVDEKTERSRGMTIELSSWFYEGVLMQGGVLSIDRAYFDLTGGRERWLYRVARKHAGGAGEAGFAISMPTLFEKSGAEGQYRRFKFEILKIAERDPLPGYHITLETSPNKREPSIRMRRRADNAPRGRTGETQMGVAAGVGTGTGAGIGTRAGIGAKAEAAASPFAPARSARPASLSSTPPRQSTGTAARAPDMADVASAAAPVPASATIRTDTRTGIGLGSADSGTGNGPNTGTASQSGTVSAALSPSRSRRATPPVTTPPAPDPVAHASGARSPRPAFTPQPAEAAQILPECAAAKPAPALASARANDRAHISDPAPLPGLASPTTAFTDGTQAAPGLSPAPDPGTGPDSDATPGIFTPPASASAAQPPHAAGQPRAARPAPNPDPASRNLFRQGVSSSGYSRAAPPPATSPSLTSPDEAPLLDASALIRRSLTSLSTRATAGEITDATLAILRAECPGWDYQTLHQEFRDWVTADPARTPVSYQNAFIGFVRRFHAKNRHTLC